MLTKCTCLCIIHLVNIKESAMTGKRLYLAVPLLAAAGVVLIWSACAPASAPSSSSTKRPIKIGLVQDFVGASSVAGTGTTRGMDAWLDNIKYEVAGRKIEAIKEDTKSDPKTALERAKKLVELDQVDMLVGESNSGAALALKGYADQVKVPYISAAFAGVEGLTLDKPSPYVYRTTYADGQAEVVAGRYIAEKMGKKKAVTIVTDFVGGWGKGWAFKIGFEQGGGKVVQELFAAVGETDFASYINQINPEADVIWAFFPDEGTIRFPKQFIEMGMNKKIAMTGYFNIVSDRETLPVLKDNAVGFISAGWYNPYCDTEENKLFQKVYQAKFNTMADMWEEPGWRGMAFITAALKSINGDVEDKDKLLKALSTTKINAPCTAISLDENRNVIQDIILQRVEKVGDKFQNKVIDTVKQVRQPPAGTTIHPGKK